MPAQKRSHDESTSQSGGRRRSGRISSTGKKSSYFEDDVDETDDSVQLSKRAKSKSGVKRCAKKDSEHEAEDFQYKDESEDIDDENTVDEEDDVVEAAPPAKKRGRLPKSTPKTQAKVSQKKQSKPIQKKNAKAESGAEDDDDERITITRLPTLKDTGGIEYEDERIHPNTMAFLKELKNNNNRAWLKMFDAEYRRTLKDWETFVKSLTEKIIEADETIPELPLKDVIFRIYRDIRFSKDPTPYKPHYSAAWSRTGRKGPYACYYVHCEPGGSFVGGGLWHPDKDTLAKLRANIDERPHRLRRILMNPQFRNTFLPNAKDNEKSVLAAFAESNKENALKTKPQGFHPDHRDIELLKLRNYTVGVKIKDSDWTSEDAHAKIMAIINPMVEYVTFLNSVVMPDPNFDNNSSDDEENDEDENDEE